MSAFGRGYWQVLHFVPHQTTLEIYRNLDHSKGYQPNLVYIIFLSCRTLGSIKQPLLSQEDVLFCDSSIGSWPLGWESGTEIISVSCENRSASYYCCLLLSSWCKQLQVTCLAQGHQGIWSTTLLSQKPTSLSCRSVRDESSRVFDTARLLEAFVRVARSSAPDDELSDWATVCTDSELRGFLSSSSPWDPSPHYLEWECGREAERQEREKQGQCGEEKQKNSIWIIICLLSRQRLTAGVLVCDQLDMCAFNKPGKVAFVHHHASGQNYKAENNVLSVKERWAVF